MMILELLGSFDNRAPSFLDVLCAEIVEHRFRFQTKKSDSTLMAKSNKKYHFASTKKNIVIVHPRRDICINSGTL